MKNEESKYLKSKDQVIKTSYKYKNGGTYIRKKIYIDIKI